MQELLAMWHPAWIHRAHTEKCHTSAACPAKGAGVRVCVCVCVCGASSPARLADGMRRRSERSRQSCRSQLPLRCILASCSSPSGGRSPSDIRCCACSCASSCCWLAPCCCSRCCWLAPSCCSHCASSCCSAPLGLAQGPPTPVLPPRNSTASWRRSISITSSDRSYSNTCRPVLRRHGSRGGAAAGPLPAACLLPGMTTRAVASRGRRTQGARRGAGPQPWPLTRGRAAPRGTGGQAGRQLTFGQNWPPWRGTRCSRRARSGPAGGQLAPRRGAGTAARAGPAAPRPQHAAPAAAASTLGTDLPPTGRGVV